MLNWIANGDYSSFLEKGVPPLKITEKIKKQFVILPKNESGKSFEIHAKPRPKLVIQPRKTEDINPKDGTIIICLFDGQEYNARVNFNEVSAGELISQLIEDGILPNDSYVLTNMNNIPIDDIGKPLSTIGFTDGDIINVLLYDNIID